ncbi:MAG TPA: S1 RNA-binding domain-containing protein, partial [Gemmataceae bacterium]|nr:S1 RNA-binding domain-containing protein [Gemmataceae bacterium]
HMVETPKDVVQLGDEIEVKVLRVDAADRKIGLSRRRRLDERKEEGDEGPPTPTPSKGGPQRPLRVGASSAMAQVFNLPEAPPEQS